MWLEAAATVEGELRAEVVDEAYEVYVAEAGRTRLVDREGPARLHLRSGTLIAGDVVRHEPVAGHLRVRLLAGEDVVVPTTALVAVHGTRPRLRSEARLRSEEETAPGLPDRRPDGLKDARPEGRSVSSWLRACWLSGLPLRVGTVDGATWAGTLAAVGADHVALLDAAGEEWLLPFASVEYWRAPHALD